METGDSQEIRRRFAAKYKHHWLGWISIVSGATAIFSGDVSALIIGVLLFVLGIYLLRGKETNPSKERSQKRAEKMQADIDLATRELASSSGGKAVVAYRNLASILKSTKLPNYQERLTQIITEIGFDSSSIKSDLIGTISRPGLLNRDSVEVYKNWIIAGKAAFDVEPSTKGEVHVEGNIQLDSKGRKRDMRQAYVHFVSTSWSKSFPISVDDVSEARRIVAQLSVVTEALKPTGVTSSDITKMIDVILSNSGQPPAEKLKQLSDLRFQRLLSDSEFEAAKARILGI